jgi:hypothetical protein
VTAVAGTPVGGLILAILGFCVVVGLLVMLAVHHLNRHDR